jgi:hypothetical protein
MKRFMIYGSFTLLLLLCSIGQIQALTTIDTTPSWNGTTFISSFGNPNTATYGQVVTVPSTNDTVLQSFSFYIKLSDTCPFRGYVYAWDGTKATGSALYKSPVRWTSSFDNFEEVTFETGGIALTPGAQYVLFASTSEEVGLPSAGRWGAIGSNVYTGGTFVYINNGTNTAEWTTVAWSTIAEDLAFRATFVNPSRKILYWNDFFMGTDYMNEALVNIGNAHSTSTTIATGLADFESKVAAGGWDLVILMIQGGTYSTPNFNSYVSGGGRTIFTDWNKDATRGALFGVTYSGNDNQNVVRITDSLLLGGVANPMSLFNPGTGYGRFSMGMTSSAGTVVATFPNGDAAIVVGANGKTIVNGFLTDTPTSASAGVALFENEINAISPPPLTVAIISPNGGENVPAGSVFNITWLPGTAVSFNVDLSTNSGRSWKSLVKNYGESNFEWWVPLQRDNVPNCMIRVTGFDSNGVQVAQDVSDHVFTIEVAELLSPDGGETLTSSATQSILWATNETMGNVASVQLFYTLNGTKWNLIATITGNPGAYLWTVPTVTAPTTKCKVKVLLKNALAGKGKTLGTAISDAFFTIHP